MSEKAEVPERGAIRGLIESVPHDCDGTSYVRHGEPPCARCAVESELAALEAERDRFQQAAFDADQSRRAEAVWRGLAEDKVADLRTNLVVLRDAFAAARPDVEDYVDTCTRQDLAYKYEYYAEGILDRPLSASLIKLFDAARISAEDPNG